MKNVIIVMLSILVIGMPVGYYVYRQKKLASWQQADGAYDYKVSTHAPGLKGYLLFAPITEIAGDLVIMDMTGKMIMQKHINNEIFDFRQWHVNGKTYYSYSDCKNRPSAKITFGASWTTHLMDSAFNEIKQLKLSASGGIDIKKIDHDPHDVVMLSEDHFIKLLGYHKTVNNIPSSLHPLKDKVVFATMIQETVNDSVIWQWDASDYPEFYTSSKDGNNFSNDVPADYVHVNTLTLDPKDSNLILSFRSLSQIIKINRHTGAIMWRLGGANSDFPMAEEQMFLAQHAVKLIDSGKTLQFLDNGNPKTRPYSRILEIRLDEQNKKLTEFKSYKIPHSFIPSRGNVSNVGDNYLICGGLSNYILLVDPKTDRYLFELQGNWGSYRAYWVENLYGLEKGK